MQTRGGTFEESVANALCALDAAEPQFQLWRSTDPHPDVELELMHLQSLALLADHRGRHLVAHPSNRSPLEDDHDLVESLTSAHVELVGHASADLDITGLKFLTEMGALCQGVRHYVDRH